LRVVIVAANPFLHDSRFLRSAQTLAAEGHRVTIVAWSAPGLPDSEDLGRGIRLVRIPLPEPISNGLRPLPRSVRALVCRALGLDPTAVVLPAERATGWDRLRHPLRRLLEITAVLRRVRTWTDQVQAVAPGAEILHCQSLIALPVALGVARRVGGRFVYDVADYHPGAERIARMPALVRLAVARRERAMARQASGFLAVSDAVARHVAAAWEVPLPRVLLNCPPAWRPDEELPGGPDRIRDATGTPPDRPIVLFQGGFSIDRGLEELVRAIDEPSLRPLDPMLVFLGYGRLRAWLEQEAARRPGRMSVLPAVPVEELLEWTMSADVSFIGQPPWTANHRMNLPNKLFESLMAGVPVIVAAGNEQCRLVRTEGVGECTRMEDPAEIASAIARILGRPPAERESLRRHCRRVALARYSWEHTAGSLIDLYRDLARSRP
jgi:glycosyltransferase involved in cell wall biosynthesis